MKNNMTNHIYRVDEIRTNSYMGDEYIEKKKNVTSIFLFGKTLSNIAPNLKLKVGDKIEIEKDDKHFTVNILKIPFLSWTTFPIFPSGFIILLPVQLLFIFFSPQINLVKLQKLIYFYSIFVIF